MEYTEEEKKAIEEAINNILRGNDIESAMLILEKCTLNGLVLVSGRINISKLAVRQVLNFLTEYKEKGYLDVVREKVSVKNELFEKNNLIEKQQKEIERLGGLNIVRSGKNLLSKITSDYVESASKEIELQSVSGYTIDFVIDLFKRGFVLVNEKEFKKGKDIIKKTRKSRITGRGGKVNRLILQKKNMKNIQ